MNLVNFPGFGNIFQVEKKKKKKAPKRRKKINPKVYPIWGRASYGRMLHLCSKRAQSHKLRVQERIAANLKEQIAFEELDKGLEPLLEVEVSSKYKTKEEIVAHCNLLKEEGGNEMIDFFDKEFEVKLDLIEYLNGRIDELYMKFPTRSSNALEGLELKINKYQAFVDLLSNELQFLEQDYLD